MVEPDKYSTAAIILHWLMALLIAALFGLGWYMTGLTKGSPERSWFFALHKSLGLTVALLALVRLGWRLRIAPPELPAVIPYWKRLLAEYTHLVLYLLMFLQPVSGYLSSSFSGYSTRFWGVPLPDWGWKNEALNQLFTGIHVASSITLLALIVLHIIGALQHGLQREESVMLRMWPGSGKS